MTPNLTELDVLRARIDKVEQQNQRMKRAGLLIAALAVGTILLGQAPLKTKVIEAEGLILRDGRGKKRLELAVVDRDLPGRAAASGGFRQEPTHQTGLWLYDENGHLGAVLLVTGSNPGLGGGGMAVQGRQAGLRLYAGPRPRAELAVDGPVPSLSLYGGGGLKRAALAVGTGGTGQTGEVPNLAFTGEDGKFRMRLAVDGNQPVTSGMDRVIEESNR